MKMPQKLQALFKRINHLETIIQIVQCHEKNCIFLGTIYWLLLERNSAWVCIISLNFYHVMNLDLLLFFLEGGWGKILDPLYAVLSHKGSCSARLLQSNSD